MESHLPCSKISHKFIKRYFVQKDEIYNTNFIVCRHDVTELDWLLVIAPNNTTEAVGGGQWSVIHRACSNLAVFTQKINVASTKARGGISESSNDAMCSYHLDWRMCNFHYPACWPTADGSSLLNKFQDQLNNCMVRAKNTSSM